MQKTPSESVLETFQQERERTPTRILPQQKYIKYQTEILGVGSFKRVYKCLNVENGKEYAWNEISLDKADPWMSMKIFQEIAMYKRCSHPNILKITDSWFNDDNLLVFTTELIPGGSLYQFMHKSVPQIRLSVIQRWATQVLEALVYLHANSIIHRDLKSQNVYIDQTTGILKVGDLGLATMNQFTDVVMDGSKQSMVGTTEFMAPEIYGQAYNEKVDVYAFGLLLLEIATKEYPYAECKHTMEIFHRVTHGVAPEALRRVSVKPLQELITRAIVTDPVVRPSAKQLLQMEFFQVQFADEVIVFQKEEKPEKKAPEPRKSTLYAVSPQTGDSIASPPNQSINVQSLLGAPGAQKASTLGIKIMKKTSGDPETCQIIIAGQLAEKETKAQFVLAKTDKKEDIAQEILNIQQQMEPLRVELSTALGKLLEKWLREGVVVDEVFLV